MDSKSGLSGRLAQLRDLVSRPELNGAYVLILDFSLERDRFMVQTIPTPNSRSGAEKFWTKQACLRLCSADQFSDKYPWATKLQASSWDAVAFLEKGSIFVLDAVPQQSEELSLSIKHSYRIVGIKTALNIKFIAQPATIYRGSAVVIPCDESEIVVIEDIRFVGSQSDSIRSIVACYNGRNITFRRCCFDRVVTMVAGNDPLVKVPLIRMYGDKIIKETVFGFPNVVFESCVFEADNFMEGNYALQVGQNGRVTLLNCFIRNFEFGVLVTKGGHATLKHCTIENTSTAVRAHKETGIDMLNCTISLCKVCGIHLDRTGPVMISGCKIEKSLECGMFVRGARQDYHLKINDCDISDCCTGVCINMGKMAASINSTTIRNNKRLGLSVCPSVRGSVTATNCSISGNGQYDILNGSHAQCEVVANGKLYESLMLALEQPKSLQELRSYQCAGIYDLLCENCGKKEEEEEKFKKCGKCEDVIYCSRECQKAHWKEHKKECVATDLEPLAADTLAKMQQNN